MKTRVVLKDGFSQKACLCFEHRKENKMDIEQDKMDISAEKIERLAASAGVEYETARLALLEADGDLIDAVLLLERQGKVKRRGIRYNTCGNMPDHAAVKPSGSDGRSYGYGNLDVGCGDSSEKAHTGADNADHVGAGYTDNAGHAGGYGYADSAGYTGSNGYTGCGGAGYTGNGGASDGSNADGARRQYRDESTSFEDFMRKVGAFLKKAFHAGCVNHFEVWREERRILFLPVLLLIVFLIPLFWLVLVLLVIGLFCRCRYRFSGPNLGRRDVNDAMDGAADAAERFKKEARDDRKNPK